MNRETLVTLFDRSDEDNVVLLACLQGSLDITPPNWLLRTFWIATNSFLHP